MGTVISFINLKGGVGKTTDTNITNRAKIKEAAGKFLPICICEPRGESTTEFKLLCAEILNHINSNQ